MKLFVAALVIAVAGGAQEPLVQLFGGTLKGWVVENTTANNFTVTGGVLRIEGPSAF